MKLKICPEHGYTLHQACLVCQKPTQDAHYKFIKLKSVKEDRLQ